MLGGIPEMVFPPVITRPMPRKISKPPKVTTNAGTPIPVTRNPCQAPIRIPTTTAANTASGTGQFRLTARKANAMAHKPTAEPIERSISPVTITRQTPHATIPVMAACLRSTGTLREDRKRSSVKTWNTTARTRSTTISP